jgi:short-subunit dehydrogenase
MSMDFAERYGPWAIVAGASEGTGRAFARQIAAKGVKPVLIARREAPLAELADAIRAESGVESLVVTLDLAAPDATEKMIAAVGDREIGLFVSNAGADTNGAKFLDRDLETWMQLIRRNVLTVAACCHHFGGLMRERGHGGLLLVNSGAAWGGGSFMAVYSAAKAFDLCLAESLWGELKPHGVDVLTFLLGITDTPPLRALLAEKGLPHPPMASPDDVARVGLERLSQGPVYDWREVDGGESFSLERRARVLAVNESSKAVFGD